VTALLLAWNVFAGGRIAQLRTVPRAFRIISGLCGFLVIPAMIVGMAEQSELTGHALAMLPWMWPAVLALFVVQSALALERKLLTAFIGVPLLLYNLAQLLIALTRVAAAHGVLLPAIVLAAGAAQASLLTLVLGAASVGSPVSLMAPLLAPAGKARWRPAALFRSALALFAFAVLAALAVRAGPAYAGLASVETLGAERMADRVSTSFEVGLRILPELTGAPGIAALREDFALADSLGVGALQVRIASEGCTAAALDSLARSLDPYRRDSVLLIVTLATGRESGGEHREPMSRYIDRRAADVDRIVRRLRPDIVIPADPPFGAATEAVGTQTAEWWEEYYTRIAAVVHHDRPVTRTLMALAADRDSALFEWALSGSSPVDGVAIVLATTANGYSAVAALVTADRWMGGASIAGRPVWVTASVAPSIAGENAQRRLLHHVFAWATTHPTVQGVVLGDAGDYDRIAGFRARGGRLRPVVGDVAAAIFLLSETVHPRTP
jgi:hypothetical protein